VSEPTTAALAPVLSVRSLRKQFTIRGQRGSGKKIIVPVDNVSFDIMPGRTMALVGESGSGKSTLARLIMRLYKADAGSIAIDGVEIQSLGRRALRRIRNQFQMVFQNPLLSFDPSMTIGSSIAEVHRLAGGSSSTRRAEIAQLLSDVGLSPAFADLRPRGVSGGELQRAALARAISVYPKLLVLDEPTSALDVSIQGQVLSLLATLQRERGMAYLFATHDLKVVRLTSHDVIVLYRGKVMERATTEEIFARPRHPYTLSLLAAERVDAQEELVTVADGACPLGDTECTGDEHSMEISPTHWVRCWRDYAGPGRAAQA
jgi:ABC-type glutathione transport system ATPase component